MNELQLIPPDELSGQFEVLKSMACNLSRQTGHKPFVIAFTSCESAEGVTSVAVNFAAALIQDHQHRVLLVDGNMNRPSLQRFFRKSEGDNGKSLEKHKAPPNRPRGMRDWQIMWANANLDVILAQDEANDDPRMMRISELVDFLEWVKREYEFVVIDCPSLHRAGGAAVIAAKADAVVLVVEAGRVRREAIQRSVNTLEDLGANILGVVLNKRRYPIPRFIYRML